MSEFTESPHLVIACGGTGGHFYPTLAIAKEYSRRGGKVTLLVSGKHAAEQKKIAKSFGFFACETQTVRLPDRFLHVLTFPFQFCNCILKARSILRALHPDILLGMGSFAAVPPCLAMSRKELSLVLHEGNSFMGKANRWLAWKASAIALSLPLRYPAQLKGKHSATVGMPLREAIVDGAKQGGIPENYLTEHGLLLNRRTILVFGGSQGARFINELITNTLPQLHDFNTELQFIHLTGTDDNGPLLSAYQKAGIAALVQRSEPNIENCYRAADLVICRSGASSICEIALYGKPLLLIPLPTAADDHQRINAEMLQQNEACRIFTQSNATPEKLLQELNNWREHPEEWALMAKKLLSYAHPAAASAMVDLLQQVISSKR